MTLLDALWLGIMQGITEFLPISSSGHLVVLEQFLALPVEKLKSFDVAVHVGTLLSILFYFRKELIVLLKSVFTMKNDPKEELFNMGAWQFILVLIVATVPAVVVGLAFESQIDSFFREADHVGYSFLATAILFLLVELALKRSLLSKMTSSVTVWKGLAIGVFQAIAIIPGVSRSGSTISGGLLGGLKRTEAARFSFIVGVPALMGAGLLTAYKMSQGETVMFATNIYLLGATASFVSGYISIALLMRFLKQHSLAWFSLYLIPLGFYLIFS